MGRMAWSEDTRCLYCEGRLPLYRKITHGQFCSNAHRKAYWEEQERLAVERLHQSHNSLRAHRSSVPEELTTPPEPAPVENTAPPHFSEAVPNPAGEQAPFAEPELSGYLRPEIRPCYSCSLHFIATEPSEYEIALNPFSPRETWSCPDVNPFPLGERISIAARLAPSTPQHSLSAVAFAECDAQPVLCHPAQGSLSPELRIASRTPLPLASAFGYETAASSLFENVQPLAAEATPVTGIEMKSAPQGDLLVELLDQQVPHPDSLLALSLFAAQPPVACSRNTQVDTAAPAPSYGPALPESAMAAVIPDYALAQAAMHPLSSALSPATGTLSGIVADSENRFDADSAVCYATMPAPGGLYEVSEGALQRLPGTLLLPVAGRYAPKQGGEAALDLSAHVSAAVAFPVLAAPAGALSPVPPADGIEGEIGIAPLRKLPSNVLRPAEETVSPKADGLVWDLSGAVSSDVSLPVLTPNARGLSPRVSGILPLRFAGLKPAASPAQPAARLIPQSPEPHPLLPILTLEPMDRKPAEDALRPNGRGLGSMVSGEGLSKLVPAWAHASGFWQHAPRDLKLLLFAIPALLALVFHPGLPRVAYAAPQGGGFSGSLKRVLNDQFSGLRQSLENRAAVALDEDFRSGLDNWASPGGSTTEWSFDSSGFVKPGPLAIYRPSVNLADYQTQFMGTIDKKALSWVVRAADFENFYVIKLVVVKPGPIPTIGLTRYAVIGGKAQDRHDVNIPLNARADTLYSVRMNVQGSNFSVEVQGQMADSWTETRLPRGGVGFFTARGEESRVRWVQITHQYDMLGRLCAYLAPLDTTNGSWQP